ncbi:hypothetical protein ACTMTJ_38160 [Phytohabitans sp. LJ34]|uniref:hypothetical protein n=1 Tax=Phytohabitans sp. LJ34 TaxID=3452217 RepID=UPI003F8CC163
MTMLLAAFECFSDWILLWVRKDFLAHADCQGCEDSLSVTSRYLAAVPRRRSPPLQIWKVGIVLNVVNLVCLLRESQCFPEVFDCSTQFAVRRSGIKS